MRLAVVSDIHGNLVALEAVLADLRDRAPDAIVNLGDCVTSPLWPAETMALLETLKLPTVRGNHDRWLAELPIEKMGPTVRYSHDALTGTQRAGLGALPATLSLDGDVLAVHGTPDSDTDYLLEQVVDGRLALAPAALVRQRLGRHRASLILCGHSHLQHLAAIPGGGTILNPGSVGCPRYADNANPFDAEAGTPHAFYALATKRKAAWSFEMIALGYDNAPVVARARANGRTDWARGFLGDPGFR